MELCFVSEPMCCTLVYLCYLCVTYRQECYITWYNKRNKHDAIQVTSFLQCYHSYLYPDV